MPVDPERRAEYGPRRSDPNQASAARVYDYLLGGEYNYDVDKIAAARILREFPLTASLARYNRAWVQRAVAYLYGQGVRQFLDIGSGIPSNGNVHEIVQALDPTTRVVYADWEKVAIDLGNEQLANNPYALSIHADMRDAVSILDHTDTRALLNFDEPVAMVWGSMLHFVQDRDDPFALFEQYKERLGAGSYIALSHITEHFLSGKTLEQIRLFITKYNEYVSENLTLRPMDRIESFFSGTEVAEPGIVPLPDWRPENPDYQPDLHDAARGVLVGGVGRLV